MALETLIIGADHAGYALKEALKPFLAQQGLAVTDAGTDSDQSVDYPDYGALVAEAVSNGAYRRGILICGSGVGMSIVANRFGGVRAALCRDEETARLSRMHNDANVLVLASRMTDQETVFAIVRTWLTTPFEGGRHQKRLDKISINGKVPRHGVAGLEAKSVEATEQREQTGDGEPSGRPVWDAYFMEIVGIVAKRATCLRRRVGAALVRDRRILSTGYNGAPSGLRHCLEIGCLREQMHIPSGERHELCRGLHAEQNAIIQAALHGVSVKGATLYCTNHPCVICAKMIINAGIVRIVIGDDYRDVLAEEMLAEAHIEVSR